MRFRSVLALFILALLGGVACGESRKREPGSGTVGSLTREDAEFAPIRDSIRARAVGRFRARPDSLMPRADAARALGDTSAHVWVILVAQLQCAACSDAVRDLLPVLRREYVETGRIRLAYVNGVIPDTAFNAKFAIHAAYCAALAGKFWPMLDSIAATRTAWAREPDPQPRFDALAVRLGADAAVQKLCTTRALMQRLINLDRDRAEASGVTVLPTLLVGSTALSGDLSLSRVRAAIDAALASAPASAPSTRR